MRLFLLMLLVSTSVSAVGKEIFLECTHTTTEGELKTKFLMIDKANSKGTVTINGVVSEYRLTVTPTEYILKQPDWQANLDRKTLDWRFMYETVPAIFGNDEFHPCKIMEEEETLI